MGGDGTENIAVVPTEPWWKRTWKRLVAIAAVIAGTVAFFTNLPKLGETWDYFFGRGDPQLKIVDAIVYESRFIKVGGQYQPADDIFTGKPIAQDKFTEKFNTVKIRVQKKYGVRVQGCSVVDDLPFTPQSGEAWVHGIDADEVSSYWEIYLPVVGREGTTVNLTVTCSKAASNTVQIKLR